MKPRYNEELLEEGAVAEDRGRNGWNMSRRIWERQWSEFGEGGHRIWVNRQQ